MSVPSKVYITGGSSGIGLALAQHYVQLGSDVTLLARDPGRLEQAAAQCRVLAKAPGQVVATEPLDVTAYDELPAALERIVARHGLPDLLILCAGVAGNKRFLDTPAAEFDRMLEINLGGSREVLRCLLPAMLARGSGQLALVSSVAGLMGIYGYGAYSASKFAVTGLAQALRQELAGTGVTVHLVCPPETNTPKIALESLDPVPQTRFLKDLVGTLEPEVVARQVAAALGRGKAVVVPGARAKLFVWMSRVFPELFARSCNLLLRLRFRGT